MSAKLVAALRPIELIPVQEDGRDLVVLRDPAGFSESMLAVPEAIAPILSLFDGYHTYDGMVERIKRESGVSVPVEKLREIGQLLDDAYFLENERFEARRSQLIEEFRNASVRSPILTGQGIPDDPGQMHEYLDSLMQSEPSDDFEAETPPAETARGLLAPHIDFLRGGATYGRAYRELSQRLPDPKEGPLLIGIIGVGHAGSLQPLTAARKHFETILGTVPLNHDALNTLTSLAGKEILLGDEWLHKSEHSIELQLYWLQHVLQSHEISILPLLAGSLPPGTNGTPQGHEYVETLIDALKTVESNHPGPVLWVGSVDFAHVGPNFGDETPVDDAIAARVEKQDMTALENLQQNDPMEWWSHLIKDRNARRVCGQNATWLLLRLLRGTTGYIIDYAQALSPRRDQMVSYASALFL